MSMKMEIEALKRYIAILQHRNSVLAAENEEIKSVNEHLKIQIEMLSNPFGNTKAEMKVEAKVEGDRE